MKRKTGTLLGCVVAVMLVLTPLTAGQAATAPASGSQASGEPQVEAGKITSIPPQDVSGAGDTRSVASAAVQCHQQKIIMSYPEARFTGIKKWCFDGKRVTSGTMAVQAYVNPKYRYTSARDGWVYIPKALKKTDQFLTIKGVEHAAHKSTRIGRFEYRVHGQAKPQTVYIPSVSRTGYGTGACGGPKPTDLAPRITSFYPRDGQKNAQRHTNIVAKLNMEAKEGTSNPSTFYAENTKTGEYVEGTTGRYSKDLSMIIIVPDKPFAPNTTYTATIAAGPNGVLGKTGDPLLSGKKWSFTTGSQ